MSVARRRVCESARAGVRAGLLDVALGQVPVDELEVVVDGRRRSLELVTGGRHQPFQAQPHRPLRDVPDRDHAAPRPVLAGKRLGDGLEPATDPLAIADRELHPEPLAAGRPLLRPLGLAAAAGRRGPPAGSPRRGRRRGGRMPGSSPASGPRDRPRRRRRRGSRGPIRAGCAPPRRCCFCSSSATVWRRSSSVRAARSSFATRSSSTLAVSSSLSVSSSSFVAWNSSLRVSTSSRPDCASSLDWSIVWLAMRSCATSAVSSSFARDRRRLTTAARSIRRSARAAGPSIALGRADIRQLEDARPRPTPDCRTYGRHDDLDEAWAVGRDVVTPRPRGRRPSSRPVNASSIAARMAVEGSDSARWMKSWSNPRPWIPSIRRAAVLIRRDVVAQVDHDDPEPEVEQQCLGGLGRLGRDPDVASGRADRRCRAAPRLSRGIRGVFPGSAAAVPSPARAGRPAAGRCPRRTAPGMAATVSDGPSTRRPSSRSEKPNVSRAARCIGRLK